jgi:hypothetical protein
LVDGEAVILGVDGVPDFNVLHSRNHDDEVQPYGFDILTLDGEDLRALPLSLKFLSRSFTALNLLPSIATLVVARRPISRQSSTKRAHTLRSQAIPRRSSLPRIQETACSAHSTNSRTKLGASWRLSGSHALRRPNLIPFD